MSTTDTRPHHPAADHLPGSRVREEHADVDKAVDAPRRPVLGRIAEAVRAAHAASVPF